LLSIEKSGWILMDFPRNLNQAKLLEHAFTGFQSITDLPKSSSQQNYEAWSKFTDSDIATQDSSACEIDAQPSVFDGIFIIDSSREECLRRAVGRKIDPQSGTVYHQEDSPAPEADAKLLERLQDYWGDYASQEDMAQKLELSHVHYQDNEASLTSFTAGFGQLDKITGKGLAAQVLINAGAKRTADEAADQAQKALEKIISFKQINQDRDYAELKEKVKREEAERIAAEEAAANAAAAEQQNAAAEKEKASDKGESVQEGRKSEAPREQSQIGADKSGGPSLQRNEENRASKSSLHSRTSQHLSLSKASMGAGVGGSRKNKRVTYTKEYKIKIWEEMETSYIREGILALSDIKRQRESVTDGLNSCQRQFIQFLERPCSKQDKVNEFVQSFNKFSLEFPDLRKDDQTKDELMNRTERLSNELWAIVDERKTESLQ